jgi:hypothetical protein
VRSLAISLGVAWVLAAPAAGMAAEHVPGQLVVRFAPNADATDRAGAVEDVDGRIAKTLPVPGARLVKLEGGVSIGEAIRALERRDDVLYAEPNYIARPNASPTIRCSVSNGACRPSAPPRHGTR